MWKIQRMFRRRARGYSKRRLGVVFSLSAAVLLLSLSYAQILAGADGALTTWIVDADDLFMDDAGNAWYTNDAVNTISRLEAVTSTTSTITTWAMPEGGLVKDGTITYYPTSTAVYFAEIINRPGLNVRAIGSLALGDNTFTEWIVPGMDLHRQASLSGARLQRQHLGRRQAIRLPQ